MPVFSNLLPERPIQIPSIIAGTQSQNPPKTIYLLLQNQRLKIAQIKLCAKNVIEKRIYQKLQQRKCKRDKQGGDSSIIQRATGQEEWQYKNECLEKPLTTILMQSDPTIPEVQGYASNPAEMEINNSLTNHCPYIGISLASREA